jgi:DNA-binding protein H-NS
MDLSALSLPELRRLQSKVETEIRRRSESTRRALLKRVQKMVEDEGLSLSDLIEAPAEIEKAAPAKGGRRVAAAKQEKPAPVIKYRNPANPDQGWSGRGRKPQWAIDWLAAGKPLEELAA